MSKIDITRREAEISDCKRYRYWLSRSFGAPMFRGADKRALFIMLNPSIADSFVDDRTIMRCVDFADRLGCNVLDVGNLYAWRSTDPDGLHGVDDPVGLPRNDERLRELVLGAHVVVCAWGAGAKDAPQPERVHAVLDLLRTHRRDGVDVLLLRRTKTGYPEHPLYLPADLVPERMDLTQPTATP